MSTYTIRWQRHNETDIQECTDLDPRTALARLIGALRTNEGPIIIHSVTPRSHWHCYTPGYGACTPQHPHLGACGYE